MKGFLAIVAIAVVVGLVGYKMRVGGNEKLIAAPAVNDYYIADLHGIAGSHSSGPAWGVLKVVSIDGERIELAISKKAYTKSKGAERDYDNGAANHPEYFEPRTVVIAHPTLVAAVKNNDILYVRR